MDKGNRVSSIEHGTAGLVLAVTRDGKRAKVFVYGHNVEVWKSISDMAVVEAGAETCNKCGGSGVFRNHTTGATGMCFRCEGKGACNNDDRIRNLAYDRHQYDSDQAGENGDQPPPAPKPKPKPVQQSMLPKATPEPPKTAEEAKEQRKARRAAKQRAVVDEGSTLIDCKGCNTVHREDTMCPW